MHYSGAVLGVKSLLSDPQRTSDTLLTCSRAAELGLSSPVLRQSQGGSKWFVRLGPRIRGSFKSLRVPCPSLMTYLGITWRIYVF